MQRVAMAPVVDSQVLGLGGDCSLCLANGTSFRPGPVLSSASPCLIPGTHLHISGLHQWMSMKLENFSPENPMVRTSNLKAAGRIL